MTSALPAELSSQLWCLGIFKWAVKECLSPQQRGLPIQGLARLTGMRAVCQASTWGSDSGPYACTASVLTTELSPQPEAGFYSECNRNVEGF